MELTSTEIRPPLRKAAWETFADGVARGLSLTKSYLAAGYRPATDSNASDAASNLASRPDVRRRIEELRAEAAERLRDTRREEMARLTAIATDPGASHHQRVKAVRLLAAWTGKSVSTTDAPGGPPRPVESSPPPPAPVAVPAAPQAPSPPYDGIDPSDPEPSWHPHLGYEAPAWLAWEERCLQRIADHAQKQN